MNNWGNRSNAAAGGAFFEKSERQRIQDIVDAKFDIETVKDGPARLGFITNFKTSSILDEEMNEHTMLQVYCMQESGNQFKVNVLFQPYFYVACERNLEKEIAFFLEKKFGTKLASASIVEKIDLEQINHLSGRHRKFIKLAFNTISDLMHVRSQLKPRIDKKKVNSTQLLSLYNNSLNNLMGGNSSNFSIDFSQTDLLEYISDIREYDVPYHSRVSIDLDIRIAKWYKISFANNFVDKIECMEEIVEKPDLKFLAFDIETSKAELRFPDSKVDSVMMISLMYEGDAYLIVNRDFCGQDVVGFDYAPKPEFECSVTVYNESTERATIKRFFDIIVDYKPLIITSFNGDNFDWPFIHERCRQLGLSLEQEIGLFLEDGPEYFGRYLTHLDCLYWVIRDAYLPQGSHGLKAVTRSKLGYEPIEVDPEKMVPLARSNTQELAEYSISDAVATYFIYKKHIHDFIFALCTIIPCFEDEVLRKGSGTLCENLLMTEAFHRGIIFPNKKMEEKEKMYKGHWLDSETYIGGKVECLRSGVFRSDIKTKFTFEKGAFQTLIENIDKLLDFVLRIEMFKKIEDIADYEGLKSAIIEKLTILRDVPNPQAHDAFPLIYHLDVAAMYPNIILTNRLQPVAIVNEQVCSGCLYNSPENECKRPLDWQWRGEYFPLSRNEFENVKSNLEYERAANEHNKSAWDASNNTEEFYKALKARVKQYSQKTYKTIHVKETTLKQNTVCMRENSFYIDTVRAFRDRRYKFKGLVKIWKGKAEEAGKKGNAEGKKEANNMEALYESMQLAHKIILNSFYGYVMRKGARWYSMEMAAMVTHIGSSIISDAKAFVDCVGKPLELDTDGIWCLLPQGFPEDFMIQFKDGKKAKMDYPCSILNYLVYEKYCNRQYQTLNVTPEGKQLYEKNLEMSIFFELDGPYRAMIIPAAREEGKLLKKRYVVYHKSGKLAELKGFEIKRRGELNIIKIFQSEIFSQFLAGTNLVECYEACAKVAKKWLNLLKNKGEGLNDSELIEYIGESKVLSKELSEYGEQKGVGITCAKRLKELLGPDIVKGKSLCCHFLMSKKPQEATKGDRSIPIQIFSSEDSIKKKFLRKWLKDSSLDGKNLEMKEILDWDYYIERLSNTIQKIIIIPAARQGILNILPDVAIPDWLNKQIKESEDKFQQSKLMKFFQPNKGSSFSGNNNQASSIIQQLSGTPTPMKMLGSSDGSNSQKNSVQKKQITNTFATPSAPTKSQQQPLKKKFTNPFSMNTQFKSFLAAQKQHWIELKQQLVSSTTQANISNLRQMFINQEDLVCRSEWHVISISPSDDVLGEYKVWAYLVESGQIISANVAIPRVFFINSLVEYQANDQYKQVKKRLPRERKPHFLYELSKSEQQVHSQLNDFEYFETNPLVEGIYEHHQPLDFKFIVQIGNILKLHNKALPRGMSYSNYTFSLENFIGQFGVERSYLEGFELGKQFVYIAELRVLGKRIWGIFNMITAEYIFVFVHKSIDKNKYSKFVKESLPEDLLKPSMKVQTYNYDINEKAIHFIENYLQELKSKKVHGILCVLQTSLSITDLRATGLKSLNNEFPAVKLPMLKVEKEHFSSLDWQKKGIKYLCQTFTRVPEELDNAYQMTSQVQVPLCNLDFENPFNFLTDVIFARLLKQSNCISWYDAYCKSRESDLRQLIPSDFLRSELQFSGLYTGYTVEIDIGLLALNTIAHAEELKNIDKDVGRLIEIEENNNNNNGKNNNNRYNNNKKKPRLDTQQQDEMDEEQQARVSFKILQTMVCAWVRDVQDYENQLSDLFITNLHSWITNQDSHFYDPILASTLLKLIKKIFQYFISKLTGLGAKIVSATMNTILLDTGKHSMQEAHNYTQYILSTVLAQPLFKVLTLTPTKYFKILLYKDSHNYMALQDASSSNTAENEHEIEEENIEGQNNAVQNVPPRVVSHWHIAEFLPAKLRKYYELIVLEYLYKISQRKDELAALPEYTNNLAEELEAYSKKYIETMLSEKLLDAIPELESQQRRDKEQQDKLHANIEEYRELEAQITEEKRELEAAAAGDNQQVDYDREADYEDEMQQAREEARMLKKRKELNDQRMQKKKNQRTQGQQDDYEDEEEVDEDEDEYSNDGFIVHSDEEIEEKSKNKNKKKKKNKTAALGSEGNDLQSNEDNDDDDGYDDDNQENSFIDYEDSIDNNNNIRNNHDIELHRIKRIIKTQSAKLSDLQNQWVFPTKRGSRIQYSHAILEFINFLTHTLSLDHRVNEELTLVKRSCLRLLKTDDFSDLGQYKEPCMIFKVTDVVCRNCLQVTELDVFRDDYVCKECNVEFDSAYIEYKLSRFIKGQLLYYQFQDVYCVKCRAVKDDLLSAHCKQCAAAYVFNEEQTVSVLGKDSLKARQAFLTLAQGNNYELLAQIIQMHWIV